MLIVFNILLILVILLIAYWWANQGFFSSLLHLLCVIVAGAIAFAFWEPLTIGLMLRGGGFDAYAWGTSLIGLFAVSLFVLRFAADKLAPGNVDLPNSFNLGVGGIAGAASGVLTVGIFLIGASFIQSNNALMGWQGHQRGSTGALAPTNDLWVPYHRIASDFYDFVSVGALSTSRPLRQYNPDLYIQATAFRDTWHDGQGVVTFAPKAATVKEFYTIPDTNEYAVKIEFDKSAFDDEGRSLIIASSQIRLIGAAEGSQEAPYAYATGWSQYTKESPTAATYFAFNSPSQYATNVPGQQKAEILFVFKTTMASPEFVQIKNIRYALPGTAKKVEGAAFETVKRDFAPPTIALPTIDKSAPTLVPSDIQISNGLRPLILSVNQLPSSMHAVGNFLSDGHGVFPSRGDRVGRALQIEGILESAGTKIVQVNVSRSSSATVFGLAARNAGDAATPYLIDNNGGSYVPIGFINERPDGQVEIFLDPKNTIRSLEELKTLLRGETQKIRLIFSVTEGVTLVSFRLGDVTVGNTSIPVISR